MVLDLSAAGAGGVLYLQYLIISKFVHSKTDKKQEFTIIEQVFMGLNIGTCENIVVPP